MGYSSNSRNLRQKLLGYSSKPRNLRQKLWNLHQTLVVYDKSYGIKTTISSQPAMQPASRPASQPARQPARQPGSHAASQPGSQLASQPAVQPASHATMLGWGFLPWGPVITKIWPAPPVSAANAPDWQFGVLKGTVSGTSATNWRQYRTLGVIGPKVPTAWCPKKHGFRDFGNKLTTVSHFRRHWPKTVIRSSKIGVCTPPQVVPTGSNETM